MSKELNIAVARAIGFRVVRDAANVRGVQVGTAGRNGFDLPFYSDDARQVALLLREVERRGLGATYLDELVAIILPYSHYELKSGDMWRLLCATPEQHCRAFIAVCTPKP